MTVKYFPNFKTFVPCWMPNMITINNYPQRQKKNQKNTWIVREEFTHEYLYYTVLMSIGKMDVYIVCRLNTNTYHSSQHLLTQLLPVLGSRADSYGERDGQVYERLHFIKTDEKNIINLVQHIFFHLDHHLLVSFSRHYNNKTGQEKQKE